MEYNKNVKIYYDKGVTDGSAWRRFSQKRQSNSVIKQYKSPCSPEVYNLPCPLWDAEL